jgi:starch synthase (maltosyl-transferring)
LQQLRDLQFHDVDNDAIIAYSKTDPATGDTVLVVCTLDSANAQEGTTALNMPALRAGWNDRITVHDEITDETYEWGQYNYVRLEPWRNVAHVFRVTRPTG